MELQWDREMAFESDLCHWFGTLVISSDYLLPIDDSDTPIMHCNRRKINEYIGYTCQLVCGCENVADKLMQRQ